MLASSKRIACWTAGWAGYDARPPGTSAPDSSPKTSGPRYALRTTRPAQSVYPCHSPGRSTTTESGCERHLAGGRDMRTPAGDDDRDLEERVAVRRDVGDQLEPLAGDRETLVREDLAAQNVVHAAPPQVKIGQVLVNHCLSSRPARREAGSTFPATDSEEHTDDHDRPYGTRRTG